MVLFIVHIPASGLRPPPPTYTFSMCERVFLPGMGLRVGSTPEIHFMVFLCKSLKLGGKIWIPDLDHDLDSAQKLMSSVP